jgi:hypothetical protein
MTPEHRAIRRELQDIADRCGRPPDDCVALRYTAANLARVREGMKAMRISVRSLARWDDLVARLVLLQKPEA